MTPRDRAPALEQAVADAFAAGDPAALLAAQNALAANCVALAAHVAGKLRRRFPLADADEVAADCAVAVVRASRTWRPGGGASFLTWAHNAAFQWGRSRCRAHNHRGFTGLSGRPGFRPRVVDAISAHRAFDGEPLPVAHTIPAPAAGEPDLTHDEAAAALARALAGLSERHRTVLWLRFGEGLTLAAVGARLGVCVERVRQLQVAALAAARRAAG